VYHFHGGVWAKESSRGECPNSQDVARAGGLDVSLQPYFAIDYLIRFRVSVIGWMALDNIGDVDLATLYAITIKQGGEFATGWGALDKRPAESVLHFSRGLSDQHDITWGRAFTPHNILSSFGE
jgi:hypothetical protein